MFVNKCTKCQYQTPETQDWFCPVDGSKLDRWVKIDPK